MAIIESKNTAIFRSYARLPEGRSFTPLSLTISHQHQGTVSRAQRQRNIWCSMSSSFDQSKSAWSFSQRERSSLESSSPKHQKSQSELHLAWAESREIKKDVYNEPLGPWGRLTTNRRADWLVSHHHFIWNALCHVWWIQIVESWLVFHHDFTKSIDVQCSNGLDKKVLQSFGSLQLACTCHLLGSLAILAHHL